MTKYRPEIDGLRALAVVPVILFHAGFPAFAGGFVGVDVFFVISGYLIASIIVDEMRAGRFSFTGFFERRARRIIPALYAVLIVTIPMGWFFMLPDNFENLGQSIVATVGVSNNILLWLTSGYWDLSSEFKPLLHTWSLGVEEQFYFLFPLLLLALVGRGRRTTVVALALLSIGSLVLAEWAVSTRPVAAFFLLPMRAWELLLGALFAVARNRAASGPSDRGARDSACSLAGIGLIASSIALFDEHTPFPGVAAVLPTVGTLLVIMFASPANWVGRFLALRPLVAIGLASYSAYLWHQPIFAFLRLLSPEPPSASARLLAIVATGVAAYASWRWIEQPFRSRDRFSRGAVFGLTISIGALIAGAGWSIDRSGGFPARVPAIGSSTDGGGRQARKTYIDRVYRLRTERFSNDGRRKVLILGNSYARDFVNMIEENGYMRSCELSYEPVLAFASFSCVRDLESLGKSLRVRLLDCDVAILVQPAFDTDCLKGDIEWLRAVGVPQVIVLGTKNFGWNPNCIMGMSTADAARYRAPVLPSALAANARDRAAVGPGEFVDLIEMIVDSELRTALMTDGGFLISEDGGHLTRAGARIVGQRIFEHPLLAPLR